MDRLRDYVHLAPRNRTNTLIGLNNSDKPGSTVTPARFHREQGIEMRLLSILVATCALCQAAIAQTPNCKSIPDSAARLACYDKSPPPASAASAPAPRPVPTAKVDSSKYVDTISAEDALMNQRIKGICRGC
jgi:hypothetical protein